MWPFKEKYRTRHCRGCALEHTLLGCIPKSAYCKTRRKIIEDISNNKKSPTFPFDAHPSPDEYTLTPGYLEPGPGIIDDIKDFQKLFNEKESEICSIMAIPAGARLLDWSYAVQKTWWYRLFSRIDGEFKRRTQHE